MKQKQRLNPRKKGDPKAVRFPSDIEQMITIASRITGFSLTRLVVDACREKYSCYAGKRIKLVSE